MRAQFTGISTIPRQGVLDAIEAKRKKLGSHASHGFCYTSCLLEFLT